MLNSMLISKIAKANRYAGEPDRLSFESLTLVMRGDNDTHHLRLSDGAWHCTCRFFELHGSCVHILTLQKMFEAMLPETARGSFFETIEAEQTRPA